MTDVTNLQNKDAQQDTAIAGKVAIAQGSANAGKALVVGTDGNVAPGEVSGGEVWEEINVSNFPNNFVDGDELKIMTKLFVLNGSIESSVKWSAPIVIRITDQPTFNIPYYVDSPIVCAISLGSYQQINAPNNYLFNLTEHDMGTAGLKTVVVSRATITSYKSSIKIWRLKK